MNDQSRKFAKGILLGVTVGLLWGLDGVLMGRTGHNPVFTDPDYVLSLNISNLCFEFSPLVTAFFHESFCFMWVALVLLCKNSTQSLEHR